MSSRLRVSGLAIGALLLGAIIGQFQEPPSRLVFLSVGQGDSALFSSGGQNILFDTGPAGEGFDAGKALVLPKLRELGVRRLSLIVLSHPDGDHIGGTEAILKRYPDAVVAVSDHFREHPDLKSRSRGWKHMLWLRGRGHMTVGKSRIDYYVPIPRGDDNSGSIFARIDCSGATAVLSGDADAETEARTVSVRDWSAQVLKAGHHGSRTSTGDAWLRAVRPKYAVVSCGRDNPYGHPSAETMDRLERAKIAAFRTDRAGDIEFVARNGRFERVR